MMMGYEATRTASLMSSGQLSVNVSLSRIANMPPRRGGYGWSGVVSMLLHGVALVALAMLANRSPEPTLPDEQTIGLYFSPPRRQGRRYHPSQHPWLSLGHHHPSQQRWLSPNRRHLDDLGGSA